MGTVARTLVTESSHVNTGFELVEREHGGDEGLLGPGLTSLKVRVTSPPPQHMRVGLGAGLPLWPSSGFRGQGGIEGLC